MDNIFPAVVQTLAGENFTVYAYMRDGAVRLYGMKPMLEMGGISEPLPPNGDGFFWAHFVPFF